MRPLTLNSFILFAPLQRDFPELHLVFLQLLLGPFEDLPHKIPVEVLQRRHQKP